MLSTLPSGSPLAVAAAEFDVGLSLRHDSTAARPHFAAAAHNYDLAWNTDPRLPALARNRARAHFLADNLPHAIFALREGLTFAPWDADLQRELGLCRDAVPYPVESTPETRIRPDSLNQWQNRVSPFDLFLASAVASLLFAGGLFARFTLRPTWAIPVMIVGFAGIVIVGGIATRIQREATTEPFAVLLVDTPLRTGNSDVYPPRLPSPLPRGTELQVTGERGGWVQVRVAGGAIGWLPMSNVVMQEINR